MDFEFCSWLWEGSFDGILSFAKGGALFLGGWLFSRFLSQNIAKALKKTKMKRELVSFSQSFVLYATLLLISMAALSEMGIDTNSFLAVLGGAALAIGLGLKDQLGQLTAGIVLLIKQPFHIDDFVTISGETGKVESIDFFQTVLKTPDNKRVILPNSVAMSGVITNYSKYSERRLDVAIVIRREDNITVAKEALLQLAQEEPLILQTPESQAMMSDVKEWGIEVTLRCWVASPNFGKARIELLEKIKDALEKKGCMIGIPQMKIYGKDDHTPTLN